MENIKPKRSMSKQAELFYVNFEHEDAPVNGLDSLKEEHIVELLDAYGIKKANEVRLQVKVLMGSIKICTTLAVKISLEQQLDALLENVV